MLRLSLLLILATLFISTSATSMKSKAIVPDNPSVPLIEVYIESMCPFCIGFILGSFRTFNSNPNKDNLAEVVFYPYGNADYKFDTNQYDFTCQHGASECYGNTLYVCASHILPTAQNFYDTLICVSTYAKGNNWDFNLTLKQCFNDANLANAIIQCANSPVGNYLQYNVAVATPAHDHVPYVTVNGKYDAVLESKILKDLNGYLTNKK